jgi:uncharacterized protein (TIGR03790 family)
VPLRIEHDPNFPEDVEKVRPEMRRNGAALESELALLPVLPQRLVINGPIRNMLFGATNAAWLSPTNGLLMVTRLDGPTPEVARGLLDKALVAETIGLNGRAYIDLRNTTDPAYKSGDDWFRAAAEICRRLGYETVVDESGNTFPAGFPMSQIALYMGWYTEHVSGPFTLPEVEFMPGAFAYHLHSFSANTLRSTNQHWAGPLLAKGATCTIGSVDEPYLAAMPEISVFTARFLYNAMTFGEAAYVSLPALSWQISCIGDPLYRPASKNPDQLITDADGKPDPKADWSYLRIVNANLASGKPITSMAAFLEELPLSKSSAVLSEKLGDIYGALGKPSSAVFEYQRALKLDASPQQRIRLMLSLAEKLSALDRKPEAVAMLKQLLTEFPDYPDKEGVRKRME